MKITTIAGIALVLLAIVALVSLLAQQKIMEVGLFIAGLGSGLALKEWAGGKDGDR